MNGLGLLMLILFCAITHWGTANYYKAIIKSMDKARNLK